MQSDSLRVGRKAAAVAAVVSAVTVASAASRMRMSRPTDIARKARTASA